MYNSDKNYDNVDDLQVKTPGRRRSSLSTPHVVRAPEDITEEEIKMVATHVREKHYDAILVSLRHVSVIFPSIKQQPCYC